ncbi:MAG: hypothetical protein JW888_00690 [Pirellulales bacterium]|nr:hypothetical protein [Pirellulales bacterium]
MMKHSESSSMCACCSVNRRRFLEASCAACAGATGLLRAGSLARAAEKTKKTRIRVIYAFQDLKQVRPDWPNVGFDFRPVIARIDAKLKEDCPEFEFVTATVNGAEQAKKILEQDKALPVDGYLVYQLNNRTRAVRTVLAAGKPTLYADFPYGGTGRFLSNTARSLRETQPRLGFVSSSDLDDLVAAVKCFHVVEQGGSREQFAAAVAQTRRERTPAPGDLSCKPDAPRALEPKDCLAAMKRGKILAVGRGRGRLWQAIEEQMGIQVVQVSFAELDAAWRAADKDQSQEIADRWQQAARRIEDVSRETLEASAAMYLAEKELLKRHDATGITIHCLGGFYGGHLHAYPCLGFHELNNQGMIGGCECDVRSASTMVAMTALAGGRPGFISDPVIDAAKRQIIYAHCVASNRVFGPEGPSNPFEILTHSEDRKGAAVRSIFPTGYMTTTVEFGPEWKTILFHQGKAVENVDDDRACRTKLAVEPVGDIEKLFGQWDQWGWHRVTYYGDLKEPVYALADALGWKVLEEA